jgi:hypothetical protein
MTLRLARYLAASNGLSFLLILIFSAGDDQAALHEFKPVLVAHRFRLKTSSQVRLTCARSSSAMRSALVRQTALI